MQHQVIIETREMSDKSFRAYVVEGPYVLMGTLVSTDPTRGAAYVGGKKRVRKQFPEAAFTFMHVES